MKHSLILSAAAMLLSGPALLAQPNEKLKINSYIRALKYNPSVVLAVQSSDATSTVAPGRDAGEDVDNSNPKKLIITLAKRHSLAKNFEEVSILQPSRGVIFPGSLIHADDELVNGRPIRISAFEGKGAYATLSIDLPGLAGKSKLVVQNPTDSAVRAAIDERIAWWLDNQKKLGFRHSSRQSYNSTIAYNNIQAALEMGLSASNKEGSVLGELKADLKGEKRVAFAIYKQVFYTVTCDAPTRPADLMADNSKLEEVKSIITPASPPAYVQAVNYGRILLLRIETDNTTSEAELKGALAYAKGDEKIDAKAKAKFKLVLESSKVSVITLGGNSKVSSKLINARDLGTLAKIIESHSEFSKSNPGEPISYVVKFLKDNRLAKMGYTTDYTVYESKEYPDGYVKIHNDGGYVANFVLTWQEKQKVGKTWLWMPKVQTWNGVAYTDTKTFRLNPGVRNVRVHGEAAIFINTWREIDTWTFAGAPRATIRVYGTTLNRRAEVKHQE